MRKYFCLLVSVAALLSQCSSAWAQTVGPDLTIAMSHSGNFTVGVNGVETIVVSNIGGTSSSSGITVRDQLQPSPGVFGFVSATGNGWSCSYNIGFPNETLVCFSSAVIAPGGSASPITLTVLPGSSGTFTNTAVVEGGGDTVLTDNTASDVIIVVAAVPTLPESAMIALTGLLALAGFTAMRRRSPSKSW